MTSYNINYLGAASGNTNYPTTIQENQNLDLLIDEELVEVKVTSSNNEEVDYEIYYDNSLYINRLLVENITQDINIEMHYFNRADYLLGDGRAYIDTDYKINSKSIIEIDFEVLEHYGVIMSLFGSRTDYKTKSVAMFIEVNDDNGNFYTNYSNGRIDYSNTAEVYRYHRFDKGRYLLKRVAEKVYVNNNLIINDMDAQNFQCDYSMYVFAINNSNSDQDRTNFKGRIYGFKIYGDGINIDRDLIPAYNAITGEAGMFDLIGRKFYKNAQDLTKYPNSKFNYGFNQATYNIESELLTENRDITDNLLKEEIKEKSNNMIENVDVEENIITKKSNTVSEQENEENNLYNSTKNETINSVTNDSNESIGNELLSSNIIDKRMYLE